MNIDNEYSLKDLNKAQLEAVTTTEGYVRLISGAGTGKTRALTYRFSYLVNELGINPGNILCVTFTNKAAAEMRQRIHKLIGDNDTGYINTFHGFCVSVLSEESYHIQYPKSFIVLDNSDIDACLSQIYEERGLSLKDMSFSKARDMIESQKLIKEPLYYLDLISLTCDELYEKYTNSTEAKDIIFYGYLYQQKKYYGLDYNDLLVLTLHIFRENEETRLKWQKRLEYIMIDEFQDIDGIQYELMEVLSGYHKNLFVVGDPDQTIYTWRGANIGYLMDFESKHTPCKTIYMNDNYRSSSKILDISNSLIEKNTVRIEKKLVAARDILGESPIYYHAKTQKEEAEWIASEIKKRNDNGIPLGDFTILYRSHFISREIEEALLNAQIPYRIYSGIQFFDRAEVKDTLSYLRMIAFKDDLSFRRIINIPKRQIGKSRIKFLEEYAQKNKCTLYSALVLNIDNEIFKGTKASSFISLIEEFSQYVDKLSIFDIFSKIVDKSGYEKILRTEGAQDRLDNLAELKQSIYDYEQGLGEDANLTNYLEHVALLTNADEPDSKDKVKLMTIHAAKGLEFPYVFLCSLNEDVFPSKKIKTITAMEEERRLAFVALTRAEKGIFLSDADGRNLGNNIRVPSRFIFDMNIDKMNVINPLEDSLISEAYSYARNIDENLKESIEKNILKPNTRVYHDIFKEGTVIEYDSESDAHIIKFDMLSTDRKISNKVKLKVIE